MGCAELGDRDAFGIKLGPAGAVVQIFQVRGGKVVERVELVTERSPEPGETLSEADVVQAALQQFYVDRLAAPEVHLPVEIGAGETEMLEGWLSAAAERRVRTPEIAPDAMVALQSYDWPGNVRQLRNVVERTIILAPGDRISGFVGYQVPVDATVVAIDYWPESGRRAMVGDLVGDGPVPTAGPVVTPEPAASVTPAPPVASPRH